MPKFYFSLLITLSIAICSLGQTNFKPGYVITNSGDTIYGKINYKGDAKMAAVCKFYIDSNNTKTYTPEDLQGYRFSDDKYYVSREVVFKDIKTANKGTTKKVFLEYLINGKLDVFYFKDSTDKEHYFIEKENESLKELPYTKGVRYVNGIPYAFETSQHQEVLKIYTKEVPELEKEIRKVAFPHAPSLIKIAKIYHQTLSERDSLIFYERPKPSMTADIELSGGFVNFKSNEIFNYNPFQGGILFHFYSPRFNEKFFIKTGIIYNQLNYYTNFINEGKRIQTNYVKFPIYFEYKYPGNVFQPKASFGFNIYNSKYMPVSEGLSLGLNIKLHNMVYLSLNAETEFISNFKLPIIPGKLYSVGASAGLYFKIWR